MRRPVVLELRDEQIPDVGCLTRSATLTGYESLALSVGLDPVRMMQMAKLPIEALSDPDIFISLDSVATLLEESARQSRQEAFGLLLAETRRLSNLGVLALVVREEPTARAVVQSLARYMRIQNRGLQLKVEDAGTLAMIHLDLRLQRHGGARQGIEMAVAITLRTLRALTNEVFKPERLSFIHGRPRSLEVHRRVLGAPVDFSQSFDAIICRSRDLDLPIPSADPALSRAVRRWLDAQLAEARDDPLDRVRQVVRTLLPTGACSVEQVAEHLGTHRRTLNRRLAIAGENVSTIIDEVRAEMAEAYLAGGLRTLYEVAGLLGFSSGADFSRWFRGHYGMTATQWIAHRHDAAGAEAGACAEPPPRAL